MESVGGFFISKFINFKHLFCSLFGERKQKKGDDMSLNLNGSTSVNGSSNSSQSVSNSSAQTFGTQASAQALANMREANEFTERMWDKAAKFNAEQAKIQRDWQEAMSNSTYQRTVNDMIKAGINPILAAGAGLSADSIGSGSSASMSGATGAMASATPDSISSAQGYSEGHGSSWGESESGLATGLQLLGDAIAGAISTMNSGNTIQVMMENTKGKASEAYNDLVKTLYDKYPSIANFLGLEYTETNKGEAPSRKKTVTGTYTFGNKGGHTGSGHKF